MMTIDETHDARDQELLQGRVLVGIEPKLYDSEGMLLDFDQRWLKANVSCRIEAGLDLALPAPDDLYVCRPYPNRRVLGVRSKHLEPTLDRKTGSGWLLETEPGVFLSLTMIWTFQSTSLRFAIEQYIVGAVPAEPYAYVLAPKLRFDRELNTEEMPFYTAFQRWEIPSAFARFGEPVGKARHVSRKEWAASQRGLPIVEVFKAS